MPVSTAIRPVTQTADVAVNIASKKLIFLLLDMDIGKDKMIAPINIIIKNPSASIWFLDSFLDMVLKSFENINFPLFVYCNINLTSKFYKITGCIF